MHVHDTDVVNWLFGKPDAVSCQAKNVIPGSGYDVVSTHYQYSDGKVINAQADWTLQGDYGFEMSYRVNFERGNLNFRGADVRVNPNGSPRFSPELSKEQRYYFQLNYFVISLIRKEQLDVATPESTLRSIDIIEAKLESAG
jgi:predicted dehydrogenase